MTEHDAKNNHPTADFGPGHPFTGAAVISVYTRAQALDDGDLVDVSEIAREAGILYPVAMSRATWAEYVAMPEGVTGQDEQGRLWDIVARLSHAIRGGAANDRSELYFALYVRNSERDDFDPRDRVTLHAICGPGDTADPVITILKPGED